MIGFLLKGVSQEGVTTSIGAFDPAVRPSPDRLRTDEFAQDILAGATRALALEGKEASSALDLVSLLRQNQVPLLSLQPVLSDAEEGPFGEPTRLSSETFLQAVREDHSVFDEVHGHFVELAEEWDRSGVECICFKSAGVAPSFPYTSENFDILVRPGTEQIARRVLLGLGYVELRNIEEPQKWLFRLFEAGRSRSAIHVHTRVGWGQGFMIEPEIWNRRRQSTDDRWTWVPGPDDVVLINTAHAVFENKAISLHDLLKVRAACRDGVDWEYIDYVANRRGWLKGLALGLFIMRHLEGQLLENRLIDGGPSLSVAGENVPTTSIGVATSEVPVVPRPISFVTSKKLFFEKVWADKQTSTSSKPVLTALAVIRGFKGQMGAHPQNSWLVSLSGLDGSGKSRQAEALASCFKIAELRPRITWARLGATPLMTKLSDTYRQRRTGQNAEAQHDPFNTQPLQPRRGWALKIWATMSAADFAIWLLHVRWRLIRGDIVICDRYLADLDVELSQKLQEHPGWNRRLLSLLKVAARKPNQAFLLEIDPGLASQRADFDPGQGDLKQEADAFGIAAKEYNLVAFDVSQSFEETSRSLARDVLSAYLNRYGTRGNLLYFSNPWQLNRP